MLVPIRELVGDFNLKVSGVLHVGAHEAEEALEYELFSWLPITWIEAQPELVYQLRSQLDPTKHIVLEAAVYDQNGKELSFNISTNSQSSSLLEFGTHAQDYPGVVNTSSFKVRTQRLDSVLEGLSIPNFINLDIQGVELKALIGLGHLIDSIDYVYTEVNRKEVYKECDLIDSIDAFLTSKGFKRIAVRWHWYQGWGDALYIRRDLHKQTWHQVLRGKFRQVWFYRFQFKAMLIKLFTKGVTVPITDSSPGKFSK